MLDTPVIVFEIIGKQLYDLPLEKWHDPSLQDAVRSLFIHRHKLVPAGRICNTFTPKP
jgi:hypothetical protein